MTTLIPILGDQLSFAISSLRDARQKDVVLLMMEVAEETTYVDHHKAKIAFILSAMRHHAEALRAAGWRVDYVTLDDPENSGSFTGEVARALQRHDVERIVVTEAGEWRVAAMLDGWETLFGIPVDVRADDRFICSHMEFSAWAEARKQLVMEFFYREMRRKTGLLMESGRPAGGQWNYDKDNRKPAKADLLTPQPFRAEPDDITRAVLALVAERYPSNIGKLDRFGLAVTREDALKAQARFLDESLARFGDYQDAMVTGEPLLYHALLSPYINIGLLDPLELCREVEARWRDGRVPLNAAEGFIRQIIGWREYVRGVYWYCGPGYVERNYLNARRDLPAFYWTGETDMHCMKEVIGQTIDLAYAHHIQRLMITGKFALLAGCDPKQVHRWYLEVYADAYEWVELPNTLGMSQYADGGLLGSKPYAASGAYTNKMSDYCRRCTYDVARRTGEGACPFNSLYWDFLDRNRGKIGGNQRLTMPYRTWDRFPESERVAVRDQARRFLATLDSGEAA